MAKLIFCENLIFMNPFILVSKSPQRRKLLSQTETGLILEPVSISEKIDLDMNIDEAIVQVSKDKMEFFVNSEAARKYLDFLALSADTLVWFQGQHLGKPKDLKEAFQTLRLLSGQTHEVKTGVCLYQSRTQRFVTHVETTQVHFKALKDQEIQSYIESDDVLSRAGSYGIQTSARDFILKYEGSLTNVVGLPMEWVTEKLKELEK